MNNTTPMQILDVEKSQVRPTSAPAGARAARAGEPFRRAADRDLIKRIEL